MTACWKLLQKEVFSVHASGLAILLDLVDPSSRSDEDIRLMMEALAGFEACGPTTLGLNQNEANILSRLSGGKILEAPAPEAVIAQAEALTEVLKISEVVIHAQKQSVVAGKKALHR